MNKKQHPFAEVLHAIAEGEEVQCQSYYDDMWYTIDAHTILAEICSGREISPPARYRIKPRTIRIGTFDVPTPCDGSFDVGEKYWCVDLTCPDGFRKSVWGDYSIDYFRRVSGVIHKTQQAAVIHAKALLSFTKQQDKEE